jgi:hypothetical protein
MTLSLLYEVMKTYQSDSYTLASNQKNCQYDFNKILSSCEPSTQGMADFLKLSQLKVSNGIDFSRVSASAQELKNWIIKGEGLTHKRLGKVQISSLKEDLNRICLEERKLFLEICSEKDQLFTLSKMEFLTEELFKIPKIQALAENDFLLGCFEQFRFLTNSREKYREFLPEILSHVIGDMKKTSNQRFNWGRLFSIDILDESLQIKFTSTPLSPSPSPSPSLSPSPIPTEAPKIIQKLVETPPSPTPSPTPILIPTLIPTPLPTTPPRVASAFESALEKMEDQKQDLVSLDLEKLVSENPFNERQIANISPLINPYRSQSALLEMKTKDKLGQSVRPVPLSFIKLLFTTKDYQTLFNIIKVLGEKFYIINDLDAATSNFNEPIFSWLSFEKEWQLRLIRL